MKSALRKLRPVAGLCLYALMAWLVSRVHWTGSMRALIPIAFVLLLLALGMRYGRVVAMLGTIVAAVVFAHFMFAPLGSWRVDDRAARASIGWMLLAGISLSFLLLPAGNQRRDAENKDQPQH